MPKAVSGSRHVWRFLRRVRNPRWRYRRRTRSGEKSSTQGLMTCVTEASIWIGPASVVSSLLAGYALLVPCDRFLIWASTSAGSAPSTMLIVERTRLNRFETASLCRARFFLESRFFR